MKSYFKQMPGGLIQDHHRNSVPASPLRQEVSIPQNGRGPVRQRMMKLGMFFAVRILALGLLPLIVGLTRPAPALAQEECQEINELMTFDYRNWGIGEHRDCGSCKVYDLPCLAELALCQALRAKQILIGEPVSVWIRASRAAAISAGVSPIPQEIRKTLGNLYPPSLLDKVRYKTGSGFLGTLQWFRSEMEGKGAITLVDVIVFVDPNRAATDAKLWAHELEHVRQYEQLGIDGFAQAYVDQTCILPGDTVLGGYDSGDCQLERRAERKAQYYDKGAFVLCCAARNAPHTLTLRDRLLNGTEEFIARDSITVGPNVVLQAGGNVTLRAGRVITALPGFRTEPGGKLSATVEPSLNQACTLPSAAAPASQNNSP